MCTYLKNYTVANSWEFGSNYLQVTQPSKHSFYGVLKDYVEQSMSSLDIQRINLYGNIIAWVILCALSISNSELRAPKIVVR